MTYLPSLLTEISAVASKRFRVTSDHAVVGRILDVAPAGLECGALLLRRRDDLTAYRTLLVVCCTEREEVPRAAEWSANVRDLVPPSNIADLYMLVLIEGVTNEECMRIESDESFCRKYAAPLSNSVSSVLARTFLAANEEANAASETEDPLAAALADVGRKNPWFDPTMQRAWRDVLLSRKSGADLAADLIAAQEGGR